MPVAAVNGTELFYVEIGTGRPCLVMHGGLGLDHTYLHPWLDPLGDELRLIYYDHRGNGRSRRSSADTFSFEQLTADADALRVHLGLDKIAILGHSGGGAVALTYALRYPQHLTHLILVGAFPAWDYGEEILANVCRKGATHEMLAALDLEGYTEDEQLRQALDLLAPLYFHHYAPTTTGALLQNVKVAGKATGAFARHLRDYDLVDRLPDISVPTLIITGQDDVIAPPSQARRLQQGIAGATLRILSQSGHYPHYEEPAAFFSVVRDWLHGLAPRGYPCTSA